MRRLLMLLLSLAALGWALPAAAHVTITFHSFNGSVLFGRYPHAFVVLTGTLDSTGQKVDENYGFTAKKVTTAILSGPVEHMIMVEEPAEIAKTNAHFSLRLTDAQYRAVHAEMIRWRDAPGKYYDLNKRNCIHFVGAIAQLLGLKVDYPKSMLRKPKQWLNHIAAINPQLGAKPVK